MNTPTTSHTLNLSLWRTQQAFQTGYCERPQKLTGDLLCSSLETRCHVDMRAEIACIYLVIWTDGALQTKFRVIQGKIRQIWQRSCPDESSIRSSCRRKSIPTWMKTLLKKMSCTKQSISCNVQENLFQSVCNVAKEYDIDVCLRAGLADLTWHFFHAVIMLVQNIAKDSSY